MYITRTGSFDAAHRVMNEKFKCFNIHGHTYVFELTFNELHRESLGYAIDAKEIKRIAFSWIDEYLDHGVILNPHDTLMIDTAEKLGSKVWLMSIEGPGRYCNPSVENIATEMFLAMELLFGPSDNVIIEKVKVYETPNFFVECNKVSSYHREEFNKQNRETIKDWRSRRGYMQYDDRIK